MALSIIELSDLEDELMARIPDEITAVLSKLNRTGRLEEFFEMLGMSDLLQEEDDFYSYKDGKIIVVGGTEVKEKVLLGVAKELGLDKNRFEFCLDYEAIQKYDFKKMQYAPQYRVVLFGPSPHSGRGKCDSGSIIAELESSKAYPRVVRMQSGSELKITKSNFKEILMLLIEEKYI